MSDISDSENSFQLYDIDNDAVDIVSDELSCSSCDSNENEIIKNKSNLSDISPYDNNDVIEAKRLGMSVEDMFKMYQEINDYVSNEPEYTPEWPFDCGLGYSDEGLEESFYG
tara:strand:- start:755 stop:1090 length:336 start_codon:yes stop_codon:yes gene_type:complete